MPFIETLKQFSSEETTHWGPQTIKSVSLI